MLSATLIVLAGLAPSVLSHGIITSPPIRSVGAAMVSACGESVATLAASDIQSHVEGLPEAAAATIDFDAIACNVFLCKGQQFADNTANVQTYVAGQVVNFLANISIPHEGPMNVSVVETATNIIIAESLIVFDSYADESLAVLPSNNTNFNVTIPTTLGTSCANAGDCVLQWFWFGEAADQTYESCVDFTISTLSINETITFSNVTANATADSATAPQLVAPIGAFVPLKE